MPYFIIKLHDGENGMENYGHVDFPSLDDAHADVRAALRNTAGDLIGEGRNPFLYSYLICDEDGQVLREVPLTQAIGAAP